jgi:hypothetical protein
MFVFYGVFCVFEVAMMVLPSGPGEMLCCADEWVAKGVAVNVTTPKGYLVETIYWKATVVNTASGAYFWCKVGAYMGECVAGMFLIISHFTIWYYCEERRVDYCEATLDMVYDQEVDEEYDEYD